MNAVSHRALIAVVVAVGAGALIAMALLWPGDQQVPVDDEFQTTELLDATLVNVSMPPTMNMKGGALCCSRTT